MADVDALQRLVEQFGVDALDDAVARGTAPDRKAISLMTELIVHLRDLDQECRSLRVRLDVAMNRGDGYRNLASNANKRLEELRRTRAEDK